MSSSQETIHIKLGLSGTYWSDKPQYRVLFNDTLIKEGYADETVEYIEFDVSYESNIASLQVQLLGKTNNHTIADQNQNIIKDMLLNIDSLTLDDISIGQLLWTESNYHTDIPVEFEGETTQLVKNCINLGWNGTWVLSWSNPFYLWLLEKI